MKNNQFKGKKWTKAKLSTMYYGWFACWLQYEKNINEQQAGRIWEDFKTIPGYKNDLLSEYIANPVKPSVRFQQYIDLSLNNL